MNTKDVIKILSQVGDKASQVVVGGVEMPQVVRVEGVSNRVGGAGCGSARGSWRWGWMEMPQVVRVEGVSNRVGGAGCGSARGS